MKKEIKQTIITCDICKKEMPEWWVAHSTEMRIIDITYVGGWVESNKKIEDVCRDCNDKISGLLKLMMK